MSAGWGGKRVNRSELLTYVLQGRLYPQRRSIYHQDW